MIFKLFEELIMKYDKKDTVFIAIILVLIVVLILIPTGFERSKPIKTATVRVRIVETDNADIQQFGMVRQGTQSAEIKVLSGKHKGEVFTAGNTLIGKMELDVMFRPGDTALATLNYNEAGTKVNDVSLVDHYRLHVEILLFALFAGLLVLFARWVGLKALFSFAFTAVMIWKVLLPLFLMGVNPVLVSLGVVTVLTAVIIFLIGGFGKKGLVAFLGALTGVLMTCLFSIIFGALFKINGAVQQFAETLLYSGFPYLNLTQIFFAGIFLASSGAVMDIAMDISASMQEVHDKHPAISRGDLIKSGFNVGRAVIGTMTTTLLLAYSGGYTTLLLVFLAQGTPGVNILNLRYVAAEILHTLVGSFGLVLVAPATAFIGGLFYTGKSDKKTEINEETPIEDPDAIRAEAYSGTD
jgi:uncharacterized membrane protein